MNWKGENFYTGNRMATFVSSGSTFKRWLQKQRLRGVNTMFFTTEHSRVGTLQREIGSVRKFERLTTPEQNDKFVLARAELDIALRVLLTRLPRLRFDGDGSDVRIGGSFIQLLRGPNKLPVRFD